MRTRQCATAYIMFLDFEQFLKGNLISYYILATVYIIIWQHVNVNILIMKNTSLKQQSDSHIAVITAIGEHTNKIHTFCYSHIGAKYKHVHVMGS